MYGVHDYPPVIVKSLKDNVYVRKTVNYWLLFVTVEALVRVSAHKSHLLQCYLPVYYQIVCSAGVKNVVQLEVTGQ